MTYPPVSQFAHEHGNASDGFTLSFFDDRGLLCAEALRVEDVAVIDRLELILSKVSFPFDLKGGVRALRHYRHKLGRMSVTIFAGALERHLDERLRQSGLFELWALSFEKNRIALLLRAKDEKKELLLSLRLTPVLSDTGFDLLIDSPTAFGPLSANLLVTAAAAVNIMLGIRPNGFHVKMPSLINTALIHVLPQRGRRLPDESEARLTEFKLLPDRLVLHYAHPDMDAPASFLFEDEAERLEHLKIREELHITETGDKLMTEERPDEARRFYAKLLERDPSSPFAAARVAMADMAHPAVREAALSPARKLYRLHPSRRDLEAVLLQGAALLNDTDSEILLLEKILDKGNPLERTAAAMRLGRLFLEKKPQRAWSLFEKAVGIRRDDRHALALLIEAACKMNDIDRAQRFIPRLIAAQPSLEERTAAHVRVGEMLLCLDAPEAAAEHFEKASVADPKNAEAARGLAETLYRTGNIARAADRFEMLAETLQSEGDAEGAADALSRLADIWLEKEEPSLAVQRLTESLEAAPDRPERRLRLAEILTRMSRPAEAAGTLETAVNQLEERRDISLLSKALTSLAELYLFELDDPEAARVTAARGLRRTPPIRECEDLLRRALTLKGARNIDQMRFETESDVLETARDLIDIREVEKALSALETGVRLFPESVEIADALIDRSRKAQDIERLYKALLDRIETAGSLKRRADMEIELGRLCLEKKQNPSAALCWFKDAMDKVPSEAAEKGMATAAEQLQQQAERLLANGDTEAAEMIFQAVQKDVSGRDIYTTKLKEAQTALESGDRTAASLLAKELFTAPREIRIKAAVITAQVLAEEGQARRAVRFLEQAATNQGDFGKRLLYLAALDIDVSHIESPDVPTQFFKIRLSSNPEDSEADLAVIELLLAQNRTVELAEHLSAERPEPDRSRLRRASKLFEEVGMYDRAADVLESLYKATDAVDDLFLLADMLKKLGRREVLIGMLEERRNEDPRVDEMLKRELATYTDSQEKQSTNAGKTDADKAAPSLPRPETDGPALPAEAALPLPELSDNEESLNEKLSSAFSRLRQK